MSQLRFDGKVVVITGAGGGLGRQYALEYAKRGAKVVVNDLGGSLKGDGAHNSKAADVVVDEIKKLGGTAVANYDSVEFGDKIIKTAVDNFGTVHVVINNAGILRDTSFKNMSENDFKLVYDVHLNGAYKLTRAAWPYFKDQKYGRIVNTASPAGLYGNFGQANYSAAKSALIGFGETLAKEGFKYNINANMIAPLARSRMTEDVLPKSMLESLNPDRIVPLVVYLTHDSSKASNQLFELAAGYYGQVRWQRSSGELFKLDETFTPEAILAKYDGIFKFEDKPFNKVENPIHIADYLRLVEEGKKLPSNKQSNEKVSLKGKVVIITGSGAGLGRAHALAFAKAGAKVVVNDFKDPQPVVNEIKNAGGEAVGSKTNVVTESDKIVKTALDTFGRIDILVNNAGILRDRSFAKITDEEWFSVQDVHVLATFRLTKQVWPIFLKQKSGVVINTTSTSGIYGNFGQTNYAAAKSAMIGFSRTLAIEGKRSNIRVNAIAPHAETAMTATMFKKEEFNKFDASQVSPFYVLLASDKVNTTGEVFEVGAGWVGNTRLQRSFGAVSKDPKITPEFIRDHWSEITNFDEYQICKSAEESYMGIFERLGGNDDEDEDEEEDDEDAEDEKNDNVFEYTERDSILYNLGLGATAKELKYTYELSPDFQLLPTYGVIPFMNKNDGGVNFSDLLDNFNYAYLLHGEQYLKINKLPLPTAAKLRTESSPIAVQNKGDKAAIVVAGFKTFDIDSGEQLFYNEMTTFTRKAQAKKEFIKGKRSTFATSSNKIPDSAPDFETIVQTSPDQAAIYRLSGDYNPLHIDPKLAKKANFPNPILHGLGFFGVSVKQLYEKYGPFNEVKVRFTNVFFPGERLKVKAWKQGNKVIFQALAADRKDAVVINNAALNLVSDKSKL
ncbi:putative peroxisomal hydratase-dehydrogenase-epimerase [Wickerhamomyces ciferrii]|uniref:Peroxisomal hydratase-dehydrogenase-epimerase n=1 Tax=Wickerhamomyces ciferrii (strain ATCC 14091 / BCRC 22168 / CBS 111 / JCM 3599 / NBRC 0793 / NRRL Y-1031 F-60-10) TaxID=1206466 RepID=K0KLQ2_WICCF|nr:putative peroxisomal hydratase-dehydrogenase-epimerase [Wickerhamomyces ciferrii]CCH46195.1 putative peroxisomal hydratase-dehydrogenase-epimerase [Wickerhamomyces ciferrii]